MTQFPTAVARQLFSLSSRLPKRVKDTPLSAAAVLVGGVACGLVTVYGEPWLGFLLLATGVFTVATLQRPSVGILVITGVLYLLPFGVVPIPFGPIHFTFLDLTLSVTLLAGVLRLLASPQQRLVVGPVGATTLLFLGVALGAFFFGIASVSGETFRLFLKAINSVLLFFTVINCIHTRPELLRTVQILILGAGGSGAMAIALYLLPAPSSSAALSSLGWLGYPSGPDVLRYIADTPVLRATGTAIDPNVLGGMLLIALPLAVAQLLGARAVLPRPLLGVIVLVVLWALLLTYSRSAWFGALLGLGFLAAFRYKRILLGAGVMLGLLLLIPQGGSFLQRFRSGVFFADRAAQMRLGEYKDAVRLIAEYPVLGVGFGTAPRLDLYVAASSIYLLMAEEMGLVGLGAFFLVLGVTFWTSYRSYGAIQERGLEGIQLGALGGVVGALGAGLFDHYFFNLQFPHTVAFFWLFLGLTAAVANMPREQEGAKAGG